MNMFDEEAEKGLSGVRARKDGFQTGQTAKARQGPPCAVTPVRTGSPASDRRSVREQVCFRKSVEVCTREGNHRRFENCTLLLHPHPTFNMMTLSLQIVWLLILGIPVACVAWTVTHEEIFREPRQYCQKECEQSKGFARKFFYLFTCEYCFSHYVAAGALLVTGYKLLLPDWRGYLLALFALVWVANQYMSVYNRLRLDIKHEQVEIKADEQSTQARRAA